MPQHQERALVLDIASYRESSALVHLITENEARISLIARGIRNKKGPAATLSAILQPFNLLHITYSLKEGATLGHLISADIESAALATHESITAYALISFWFEILRTTAQSHGSPSNIFTLTSQMLKSQHQAPGLTSQYLRQLLQLCSGLGFAINWNHCNICNRPRRPNQPPQHFSNRNGGIICTSCATSENPKSSFLLHPAERSAILLLTQPTTDNKAADPHPPAQQLLALLELIHRFLTYHIEHPLKTFQFVRDTLNQENSTTPATS